MKRAFFLVLVMSVVVVNAEGTEGNRPLGWQEVMTISFARKPLAEIEVSLQFSIRKEIENATIPLFGRGLQLTQRKFEEAKELYLEGFKIKIINWEGFDDYKISLRGERGETLITARESIAVKIDDKLLVFPLSASIEEITEGRDFELVSDGADAVVFPKQGTYQLTFSSEAAKRLGIEEKERDNFFAQPYIKFSWGRGSPFALIAENEIIVRPYLWDNAADLHEILKMPSDTLLLFIITDLLSYQKDILKRNEIWSLIRAYFGEGKMTIEREEDEE